MSDSVPNSSPYVREVTLPSQGRFYDGQIPDGRLTVKAMTAKEEKLLAGSGDGYTVFNEILAKVVNFPKGFTPSDLISSDRLYLAIQLRNLSYGAPYEFEYTCESCKSSNRGHCNLDEMELHPTPEWDDNPEPFTLTLPSGATIKWRFLRGKHEEELAKYVRMLAKKGMTGKGDPEYIRRLALHIVEIDGRSYEAKTLNLQDVVSFVEGMYSRDTQALRNDIRRNRFGLNFYVEEECRVCNVRNGFDMPFTPEGFFRAYEHDGPVPDSE